LSGKTVRFTLIVLILPDHGIVKHQHGISADISAGNPTGVVERSVADYWLPGQCATAGSAAPRRTRIAGAYIEKFQ
jgi:hypothetical protein